MTWEVSCGSLSLTLRFWFFQSDRPRICPLDKHSLWFDIEVVQVILASHMAPPWESTCEKTPKRWLFWSGALNPLGILVSQSYLDETQHGEIYWRRVSSDGCHSTDLPHPSHTILQLGVRAPHSTPTCWWGRSPSLSKSSLATITRSCQWTLLHRLFSPSHGEETPVQNI